MNTKIIKHAKIIKHIKKIKHMLPIIIVETLFLALSLTVSASEPQIDADAVWENINNLQNADKETQKDIETIRNEISQLQSQYEDINTLLDAYTDTYNNLLLKQDMTNDLLIYLTDFLETADTVNTDRYNAMVSQNSIDIENITQSIQGTETQLTELVRIASAPDITNAEMAEQLTTQLLTLTERLEDTNESLSVVNKLSGYIVAGVIIAMVFAVGTILYQLIHNTIIKRMF